MHRFHIPPAHCKGPRLILAEGEAHHATRVLRVAEEEVVEVLDGVGNRFTCRVTSARKTRVEMEVLSKESVPPPPFQVTLLAGIPKGQLLDGIVEQATELGVRRIVPLMTERGNVRFDPAAGRAKQSKWQVTALEAIKQCGSLWVPEVAAPTHFHHALDSIPATELSLVASLHAGAVEVGAALSGGGTPARVSIWIGPEGDFTPGELERLIARGARPITLGSHVLRCPTAAIASVAIVAHELRSRMTPAA
ncbi:MAG TPA: hypothetical protein DCM86_02820 [Verrucomicrobiales bacterium]|nr:hypothetical protein [Verrucomicrobiales bacterium]